MVLTSLILVPIALAGVLYGLSGWWYAAAAVVLGVWMTVVSLGFLFKRTDASARRVFFVSITYLPVLLIIMVLDRGAVSPETAVRGGL